MNKTEINFRESDCCVNCNNSRVKRLARSSQTVLTCNLLPKEDNEVIDHFTCDKFEAEKL